MAAKKKIAKKTEMAVVGPKRRRPFDLGEKRFYVPGYTIKVTCKCGQKLTVDLGNEYLSYPKANVKTHCNVYCEAWDEKAGKTGGCGATIKVPIFVNVSVTLAK